MGRIGAKKGWNTEEIEFLQKNYSSMTIKELKRSIELISGRKRSDDSINAKIKRLKQEGVIKGDKAEEAIERSLIQRRKQL
jgi:hypothetical protein